MATERRIGRQLHNPELVSADPRVGVEFATGFVGSLVEGITPVAVNHAIQRRDQSRVDTGKICK